MPTTLDEQLAIYLTDAHAIELQALVQVKRARKLRDARAQPRASKWVPSSACRPKA